MNLLSIVGLVIFIYLVVTFTLYFFQRNLLYYPATNSYSGEKITVPVDKVKILTDDNIELRAWYHEKNINNYN